MRGAGGGKIESTATYRIMVMVRVMVETSVMIPKIQKRQNWLTLHKYTFLDRHKFRTCRRQCLVEGINVTYEEITLNSLTCRVTLRIRQAQPHCC